jgi:glycerol uptake facilitator-like aquaporin
MVVTYAFTLSNGDLFIRALAYFIVYVLASHITGAHFNPATTLAVYISDKTAGRHLSAAGNDGPKQLLLVFLS